MTTFQKLIKYLAIAFAVFLIVNIALGIYHGIGSVLYFSFDNDDDRAINEFTLLTESNALYVNLSVADLTLKEGEALTVQTNSKYIACRQDGNRILISEKRHRIFSEEKSKHSVTVYIPKDMIFDAVDIEGGVGKVTADVINSKEFSLDMGAGETIIGELNVSQKAEIEGGAGAIKIESGNIANLDADTGVGKFTLGAYLSGRSEINHGMGRADIRLSGSESDYMIKLDKGIGNAMLNGKNVEAGVYGNGQNHIDVECGVGEIHIDFFEEKPTINI